MSKHHPGHDPEGAHEHAHGFDSFLDRHWGFIVIAIGCVFVYILAHYNPTAG
jgi:hypothetical protein